VDAWEKGMLEKASSPTGRLGLPDALSEFRVLVAPCGGRPERQAAGIATASSLVMTAGVGPP